MYKLKNDQFRKARGGNSRVLDLTCTKCGNHIAYYQKDGPGPLLRMYVDRLIDLHPKAKEIKCRKCEESLGILYTYKKENRSAYKLFAGAVNKKVIGLKNLNK